MIKVTFETSELFLKKFHFTDPDEWTWESDDGDDNNACHVGINEYYKIPVDAHSIVLCFSTTYIEGAAVCKAGRLQMAGHCAMNSDRVHDFVLEASVQRSEYGDRGRYVCRPYPGGSFIKLDPEVPLYWWVEYWGCEYA